MIFLGLYKGQSVRINGRTSVIRSIGYGQAGKIESKLKFDRKFMAKKETGVVKGFIEYFGNNYCNLSRSINQVWF